MEGFRSFQGCGSCLHCDQLHSGFNRYCDEKKKYVFAWAEPCAAFVDVWSKDLFGHFLYESIKKR